MHPSSTVSSCHARVRVLLFPGPRVGFDLSLWTFTGCRIVVFLLVVPAHWWVELGLDPLLGMAVLEDGISVSRGDCGVGKSLSSLSADRWGRVPAL